ncbi:TPA: hypothetical protein ACIDZQ_004815 [Pseudomonas aeruginosa]|uniref:hypothetical protein n=2 Tax=Pseudomonas aeruginosa TaxID=287 RepID=UPI0013C46D82|nr:hypothetical protein [Pseudomonas aeruginosa]HEN8507926.1 hypothetical protein [Pseudomonas aeruginosa]HEN8756349.1 hypothetical protein [Pseudomonas aeruginosa]HEN8806120.1 hypothetical protein [Pseudomonas aeruginosa]
MQRNEFKNPHVLWHFDRVREATNNLMFMSATSTERSDRNTIINESTRISMGWPSHVKSMYDYRMMFGNVYERLFQFCVISLCSDAEIFFKETFDKYGYAKGKGNGFFQRLDDVISKLEVAGFDFSPIQNSIEKIRLAFQIRHIGIHNMGVVDDDFAIKTGLGSVGSVYPINQNSYREMFDAYTDLLKYLDAKLPNTPA